MAAHGVSDGWKIAKREALTARATALGECLDHLHDVEEMLEADGRQAEDTLLMNMRGLGAHLRSLQRDYESEAGRIGV